MNDADLTNFEGRRAEVHADFEDRLVTAKEYQATLARIDQDEDEFFRRLEAGEKPDRMSAHVAPVTARAAPG